MKLSNLTIWFIAIVIGDQDSLCSLTWLSETRILSVHCHSYLILDQLRTGCSGYRVISFFSLFLLQHVCAVCLSCRVCAAMSVLSFLPCHVFPAMSKDLRRRSPGRRCKVYIIKYNFYLYFCHLFAQRC